MGGFLCAENKVKVHENHICAANTESFAAFENFLKTSFSTCDEWDILRLILQSKTGKKRLGAFINSQCLSSVDSRDDISDSLDSSFHAILGQKNEGFPVENLTMIKKILYLLSDFLGSEFYDEWRMGERNQAMYEHSSRVTV